MKRFQILLVLWLSTIAAMAQITKMEGVVLAADDGSPILGATVTLDGTKRVVATDINGRFAFDHLTSADKTFTVTYVGMKPVTQPVAAKVTVQLEASNEMMDEVLVVAFGKQKRESFTGSASTINSQEIERRTVGDPISAINGAVAGVQMIGGNGPTATPTIRVRGITSINAGRSPLIIVDGLPYNGYWTDLNPNDIESISVLKDAASNALYGARGANGVILITTKNAKRGHTTVTLDARVGVNTDGKPQYDIIDNPAEYYEAHYSLMKNYYLSNGLGAYDAHVKANASLSDEYTNGGLGYLVYSVPNGEYVIGTNGKLNPNATLGNRVFHDGQFYTLYPDDWKKEGIRNGLREEYNLAITGGNDQYSIYASLGYLNNEGLTYGSDLKRYTARLKTDYQAFPWLKIGGNAGYTHAVMNTLDDAFAACYNAAPIYPLFIRDGDGNIMTDARGLRYDYGNGDNAGILRAYDTNGNEIQEDKLDISNNNSNSFNIQGYASVDFLHGFRFTANGSIYITENRMKSAVNPYYGYFTASGGSVTSYHYRTLDSNFQQLLNYDRSFGLHNVSALLGHEYSYTTQTTLWGSRNKVAMYTENTELAGSIINNGNNGSISKYNVEGFFARAQYDYASRYFASASFRRDGSSRFHAKHRWGNFWSLGGAWIISRESWFPKAPFVDMLKLKASYGEQGNDEIGNFRYVDYYDIASSNDNVAYVFSTKGNPDITWETVGSFNTGVEFDLFNGRLSGSLEYYNRKTSNMLMAFSVPISMGYSYYYDNIGDMNNRGVEVDLRGRIIDTRDFTWTVNLNWTLQRNKVSYIPDENKEATLDGYKGYISGNTFIGQGLPMYTWRLKRYAGPATNGESSWYVTNADGTMGTTTVYESATYYECGTALPDYFGGFGTDIRYRGFDLNLSFVYSVGGKKMDNGYCNLMSTPYSYHVGRNIHRDAVYDAWTPEHTDTNVSRWQYGDQTAGWTSDRWLKDASYLALQNITFGYTLPKSLISRLYLQKCRVYFVCDDVAIWSKRKGFDPRRGMSEVGGSGYAPMRSFAGGLSVTF